MSKQIISDIIKKIEVKKAPVISATPIVKTKSSKTKILYWTLGIIIFVSLFFGISSYFSYATVKITPKQGFTNIDLNLEADFETMQMEYEQTQEVVATGSVDGGQKASGIIAIYNTYSSKSQKLITQTRFESPDGEIYRTQQAVTVPANGSVEAKVYADKQGPEYNIKLVDFTIPGFKDTPSYEKIYGRSKTEMSGGFLGKATVATEADLENARKNLKPIIEKYLRDNIERQKPEGYILYADAVRVDLFDDPSCPKAGSKIESQDKKFIFKEKGKATGYLIKKDDLSKMVAVKYLNNGDGSAARVDNIDELNFKLSGNQANGAKMPFSLKGVAHIVWEINKVSLLNDLISSDRGKYLAIFEKYPLIEGAEIVFRPFWWRMISSDPSRTHIEEVLRDE